MPQQDNTITVQGTLWMTVDGQHFGGDDRMRLLACIADCGSISQAAKAVPMSYKTAWDAIDAMNTLAGEPLVARVAGGKGGGGTRLTARGLQLLDNYLTLQREHQAFMRQLAAQAGGLADDYVLIRRMAMKSSARNQFLGKVLSVKDGVVNDEVTLQTATGLHIVATVTRDSRDSRDSLGLAPGVEAFALVKASSIILTTDTGGARFSARNQLAGTVTRVLPGAVSTEVTLALGCGASVAAIITHDSGEALALQPGQPAVALFKASSVIVAIPA